MPLGTPIASTNNVMAMANTPSLNASIRVVRSLGVLAGCPCSWVTTRFCPSRRPRGGDGGFRRVARASDRRSGLDDVPHRNERLRFDRRAHVTPALPGRPVDGGIVEPESGLEGKGGSVRVDSGCCLFIQQQKNNKIQNNRPH